LGTLLSDILILLTIALVLGAAFARLRQSPILGYLLAGTLVGPHALNWVSDRNEVQDIAELGVALLLFSLGLEFSWRRLRQLGASALLGGTGQIVGTLFVGAAVALAFKVGGRDAICIGAMVALSSTACVLGVLMDRAEIETPHGRLSLGILLLQDIAVVPLAVLVTVLQSDGGGDNIAGELLRLGLLALGLVAALYLVLNKLAVWALGTLTMATNRELAVLLAVVAGLGSAWAAHSVHLSPALGAFVAGMILGGSPFAAQVRADIASLRMVLLTLFFGAAGMLADPAWMFRHWPLVTGVTTALVVGKAAIIWIALRLLGNGHGPAIATGLCLAQVGEFSFVLANLAWGTAEGETQQFLFLLMGSTTILTLLISPFLIAAAPRVSLLAEQTIGRRPPSPAGPGAGADKPPPPRVVIFGFGPAGQRVARSLMRADVPTVVVDINLKIARRAAEYGCRSHVGDARHMEVLEEADVAAAEIMVVTLPHPAASRELIHHLRRIAPNAHIIARSRYHVYHWELEMAGAHAVIDEEEEVGRRLAVELRRALSRTPKPAEQEPDDG